LIIVDYSALTELELSDLGSFYAYNIQHLSQCSQCSQKFFEGGGAYLPPIPPSDNAPDMFLASGVQKPDLNLTDSSILLERRNKVVRASLRHHVNKTLAERFTLGMLTVS